MYVFGLCVSEENKTTDIGFIKRKTRVTQNKKLAEQ